MRGTAEVCAAGSSCPRRWALPVGTRGGSGRLPTGHLAPTSSPDSESASHLLSSPSCRLASNSISPFHFLLLPQTLLLLPFLLFTTFPSQSCSALSPFLSSVDRRVDFAPTFFFVFVHRRKKNFREAETGRNFSVLTDPPGVSVSHTLACTRRTVTGVGVGGGDASSGKQSPVGVGGFQLPSIQNTVLRAPWYNTIASSGLRPPLHRRSKKTPIHTPPHEQLHISGAPDR